MKKKMLFLAAICMMFLASCAARTYAPFAISTVSTVSLPALQHSLKREDYQILDTIKAEAVISVITTKNGVEVAADSGEFNNVCDSGEKKSIFFAQQQSQMPEQKLTYNIAKSEGTLRYGFIEGLNLGVPRECDGNSMASYLAAYRLINEVKATDADGIVAPSLYVTAEETGKGIFSRTITYKVVISAKLIKLNTK